MKKQYLYRKTAMVTASLALFVVEGLLANTYTNDFTDWEGANLTLQDGDIVAGIHTNVGHLSVLHDATVTVEPYANGKFGRFSIYAASAEIQGNITADSAGYSAEQGDGFGSMRCGAGHGGRGNIARFGIPGDVYGSVSNPVTMGSGGGSGQGIGGSGGGALFMNVSGTLALSGKLSANGGDGGYRAGGGSGGSVWVKSATIEGDGMLTADGGNGGNEGGGGGGGRIALDVTENLFGGTIRARGKQGPYNLGRHGTYAFRSDAEADLVIEADIALPPGTNWVFRSLTVRSNAVFEIQSSLGDAPDYANEQGTHILVLKDVMVAKGGALSADGQGYYMGEGEGAGTLRGGAGHGGVGGIGSHASSTAGGIYGTHNAPVRMGSSGGIGREAGGAGGGALILDVRGTLHVDGTLSANGGAGGHRDGGGSGGSLWLTATKITGEGTIRADGGNGYVNEGGGGGGGRVLLAYGQTEAFARRPHAIEEELNPETLPKTLAFHGNVTVHGGIGLNNGEAGSILFQCIPIPPAGTLIFIR